NGTLSIGLFVALVVIRDDGRDAVFDVARAIGDVERDCEWTVRSERKRNLRALAHRPSELAEVVEVERGCDWDGTDEQFDDVTVFARGDQLITVTFGFRNEPLASVFDPEIDLRGDVTGGFQDPLQFAAFEDTDRRVVCIIEPGNVGDLDSVIHLERTLHTACFDSERLTGSVDREMHRVAVRSHASYLSQAVSLDADLAGRCFV